MCSDVSTGRGIWHGAMPPEFRLAHELPPLFIHSTGESCHILRGLIHKSCKINYSKTALYMHLEYLLPTFMLAPKCPLPHFSSARNADGYVHPYILRAAWAARPPPKFLTSRRRRLKVTGAPNAAVVAASPTICGRHTVTACILDDVIIRPTTLRNRPSLPELNISMWQCGEWVSIYSL